MSESFSFDFDTSWDNETTSEPTPASDNVRLREIDRLATEMAEALHRHIVQGKWNKDRLCLEFKEFQDGPPVLFLGTTDMPEDGDHYRRRAVIGERVVDSKTPEVICGVNGRAIVRSAKSGMSAAYVYPLPLKEGMTLRLYVASKKQQGNVGRDRRFVVSDGRVWEVEDRNLFDLCTAKYHAGQTYMVEAQSGVRQVWPRLLQAVPPTPSPVASETTFRPSPLVLPKKYEPTSGDVEQIEVRLEAGQVWYKKRASPTCFAFRIYRANLEQLDVFGESLDPTGAHKKDKRMGIESLLKDYTLTPPSDV